MNTLPLQFLFVLRFTFHALMTDCYDADNTSLLGDIQQRKDLISSGIIHVLSTQKLPGRKCRECGKPLSWNWPYAICDRCYQGRGTNFGTSWRRSRKKG